MSIKILLNLPKTTYFLTQLKFKLKTYCDLDNYYIHFTIKADKNKALFTEKQPQIFI